MADRAWMGFIWPIGNKYKGETLGMIRINDMAYLSWAIDKIKDGPAYEKLQEAKKYLEEVDPWSLSAHIKKPREDE